MAEAYEIVVGLEVHVQLLTRTKLFCGCSTKFGLPPNSATCPVCLGLPGVLPVMNRRAYELSVKAALALNCTVARYTKWDRKNYYYPDLPKGYQVSQYDLPMSHDGYLEIVAGGATKRVGIIRAHLEEDAGKLLHDESGRGGESKVDLNRTGTPLLEIVSHPDIGTPEEARAYLEELRLMLRELGVSDCEMQEGSLRCDANVNVRVPAAGGKPVPTPIVEIKNLNSISAVTRAIKWEAERQYKLFQQTGKRLGDPGSDKETHGWNDAAGRTYLMRRKEDAADYRYFPEPDLVPVEADEAWLGSIRASMGELPVESRTRLQTQYALSAYDATVLTGQGRAVVAYFEKVAAACGDPKAASNVVTNQVAATLNEKRLGIGEFPLSADTVGGFVNEIKSQKLNNQRAKDVYAHMLENGGTAADAVAALGIRAVGDEGQLRELIRRGIADNPKSVADYKAGKLKAADRIKGFVMKETKGMADTEAVSRLLVEELEKAE